MLLRNSLTEYLVLLILSELLNFSFNINVHISSVINECMCMVHYWKDSNKKISIQTNTSHFEFYLHKLPLELPGIDVAITSSQDADYHSGEGVVFVM